MVEKKCAGGFEDLVSLVRPLGNRGSVCQYADAIVSKEWSTNRLAKGDFIK